MAAIKVSAPGKVILHGEHSVVYGKNAIATSLGLRCTAQIKELPMVEKGNIMLKFISLGYETKLNIESIKDKLFNLPLTRNEIRTCCFTPRILNHNEHLENVEEYIEANNFNVKGQQLTALKTFLYIFSAILSGVDVDNCSVELIVDADLTIGAGTGSSASFAVCLSAVFFQYHKSKLSKTTIDCHEFSKAEKELINEWAFNCEKIMHGTPSGIDNSVCLYGSLVQFKKGSPPQPLDLNLKMRILLVDTLVGRETRALVTRVVELRERNKTTVDHIMSACDEITLTAVEILHELSKSPDDCKLYERLSELWNMNHCLLSALNVSHSKLDIIKSLANKYGLGSKLTGAGGGGYGMILIPPQEDDVTIGKLIAELTANGFKVTETSLGGPGLQIEY